MDHTSLSQPDKSPSIWAIERRDLFDPERLGALYVEAVRAGLWRNSNRSMLEFAALAEKAKADDTEGTPERLFASLLRRDDARRYVTNAAEERALAQFNGPRREDLVVLAHTPVGQRSRQGRQVDVFDASGLEHLGFTHAVLMQCFLPQARRLQTGPRTAWWDTAGRSAVGIEGASGAPLCHLRGDQVAVARGGHGAFAAQLFDADRRADRRQLARVAPDAAADPGEGVCDPGHHAKESPVKSVIFRYAWASLSVIFRYALGVKRDLSLRFGGKT